MTPDSKRREYVKEYNREWRDIKRANGICMHCGKNKVYITIAKTYSKCKECLIKGAECQSSYRKKETRKIE